MSASNSEGVSAGQNRTTRFEQKTVFFGVSAQWLFDQKKFYQSPIELLFLSGDLTAKSVTNLWKVSRSKPSDLGCLIRGKIWVRLLHILLGTLIELQFTVGK